MYKKALLLIIVFLNMCSCSVDFNTDKSDQAVKDFRNYYNNKEFEEIYKKSSEAFKRNASYEKFEKYMNGIYKKLGAFKKSKDNGWNVNNNLSGKNVKLGFISQFEEGEATETFTFVENNDIALLQHYNIQSEKFIIE
ncbi:MAG TPA: DUF3887 domain-containing protein [Ignavibacteria bacterium]|nr:DUF3887 domain-containing protein [Ignavibacteria bacterium]